MKDKNGAKIFISIHALRGEGDVCPAHNDGEVMSFQSTPSVGRATTIGYMRDCLIRRISIHALRGEGDHPRTHTP